jgi:aspartate 1-decarboxylase
MVPYERIEIYNINNGARFSTYVIPGPRHGGDACINGAAARLGAKGDLIIVCTYTEVEEADLKGYAPTNVYVDDANRIREVATPAVIPPFHPYPAP